MTTDKLHTYKNGNATIGLYTDGSRIIEYEDELKLEYPLNIDIRVSTKCSFANSLCKDFCHEEAKVDGVDCNYENLKNKLDSLPEGIELAIGSNELTPNLIDFLQWSKLHGYICNLTINQGHLRRDLFKLLYCIENDLIKGLGVSYRHSIPFNIPLEILNYEHTVFHVIIGIDSIDDIINLSKYGVKKILILGEKNFGYNVGNVDTSSLIHKKWRWNIQKTFNVFSIVSFDNLAVEQLKMYRFFTMENFDIFHQGEYSFYINAVTETFAPSSRSSDIISWEGLTIKEYFNQINVKN